MQSSTYKLHVCIPEQCLLGGELGWVSLSVSQLSHLSARDVHSKRSSGNCLEDQTNSSSEANRTNLAYSEFMPRKWPNYRGRTTAQVALVLTETSESNLEKTRAQRDSTTNVVLGSGRGGHLVYKDGFEDPESDTEQQVSLLHTAERSDPRGPV